MHMPLSPAAPVFSSPLCGVHLISCCCLFSSFQIQIVYSPSSTTRKVSWNTHAYIHTHTCCKYQWCSHVKYSPTSKTKIISLSKWLKCSFIQWLWHWCGVISFCCYQLTDSTVVASMRGRLRLGSGAGEDAAEIRSLAAATVVDMGAAAAAVSVSKDVWHQSSLQRLIFPDAIFSWHGLYSCSLCSF